MSEIETHNEYTVRGPDSDGELEIYTHGSFEIYLTKDDLINMLAMFVTPEAK